jgi:hypothetical protein
VEQRDVFKEISKINFGGEKQRLVKLVELFLLVKVNYLLLHCRCPLYVSATLLLFVLITDTKLMSLNGNIERNELKYKSY